MRYLVTGDAGFIGSWIVDGILERYPDADVCGLDDLSGGDLRNVQFLINKHSTKRYHHWHVDLDDYCQLENHLRAFPTDIVYHVAACAREGASAFQPARIVRSNVMISTNVFELGIKYRAKKIVQFSSMAVMGENYSLPFREEQVENPCDIYGHCKYATEQILMTLAQVHNFEWTTIRPHNVTGGSRQALFDPYRNVAGIFMNRIMRDEPIHIFGNKHRRAFSAIEDSLPAFLKAGELGVANGEVVFVGGKEHVTIDELADEIIKHFPEKQVDRIYLPSRPLEVEEAYCSTEKSERLLGYEEKVGWRESIRRMAEWAKERGPQEWKTDDLPLENDATPLPWRDLKR
jgi:nucleoside-diphosphate-sugar epimerase